MRHLGTEVEITVGGKKYKLSRFSRKIVKQFIDWAQTVLPDPLTLVKDKLKDFPPNVQEIIVKDALANARMRRSVNNPEIQALMTTPEGGMKLLSLMFQAHHPNLTDAEVEAIYEQIGLEYGEGYLESKLVQAAGEMPVDDAEAERQVMQEAGLIPAPFRPG